MLVQVEADLGRLDTGDVEQNGACVPVGVDDSQTALQNVGVDTLEGEQVFAHLVDQLGTLFSRQEGDVDGVTSEDVDGVGALFDQTCVVGQVVGVSEDGAILFTDDILQNQSGECAGIGDDDLILVDVALQQLSIAQVSECGSNDADVAAAFDSSSDVVGDHVQLHCALQLRDVALQLDGLGVKDLLHVGLELGHFVQVDSVALQCQLSCHGVSAVTAAQDCDLLGSHSLQILSDFFICCNGFAIVRERENIAC